MTSKANFGASAPLTVTRPELLDKGSDAKFREMVHNALAFSARLETLRAGYGKLLGLSGVEYTILISIAHLADEEEIGVSRVAEHLLLTGAFVTSEVNKLVKKGLVKKTQNPMDKRRVILTVTAKGDDYLRRLAPIQSQVNDVHFGTLTREDFDTLHRLFPLIAQSTEEALSLLSHLGRQDIEVDD